MKALYEYLSITSSLYCTKKEVALGWFQIDDDIKYGAQEYRKYMEEAYQSQPFF